MIDLYWFDATAAEKACEFFPDCLVHVRGRLAGQPLRLEEWQRRIISDVFGWKREDGTRKYRTVYIEVPRKNGKSTMCAGLPLLLMACDREQGAQVYSAAAARDQASIVFNDTASMIRKSPMLSKHFDIRDSQKRILHRESNSFYRALSAEAGVHHGYDASGIIFDEIHTQPNRDLWEVLTTATGARSQPLTVGITTAGHDRSSICWELHEYALKAISDPDFDPSFYGAVFAADQEDDWTNPATWAKANPCLGVSLSMDYIEQECKRAQNSPAYENTFRRLHLNQWTEQSVRWLPMDAWDRCSGDINLGDLHGRSCWGGLDLGITRDTSAFALVFPMDNGRFTLLCWLWSARESASERDRQDKATVLRYAEQRDAAGNPLVTLHDGNTQDHRLIIQDIATLAGDYNIQGIAYDRRLGDVVAQELQDAHGLPVIEFAQHGANYTGPCEYLEKLVIEGRLNHGGNKVLRWMASNVALKVYPNGSKMPDKANSQSKIDGIVATLMALQMAMQGGENEVNWYQPGALSL